MKIWQYISINFSLLSSLFLWGCLLQTPTPISVPPPGSNVIITIGETKAEARIIREETINQYNCGGSAEVENAVSRERVITRIIEIRRGIDVNANGEIGIFGTGVELGATIAEELGYAYGSSDSISRAILVRAGPGTNMQHTILLQEIWEVGDATVTFNDQSIVYPFAFRRDFDLELKNSDNKGCPTTTPDGPITVTPASTLSVATPTSTNIPSPTATNTSVPTNTSTPTRTPTTPATPTTVIALSTSSPTPTNTMTPTPVWVSPLQPTTYVTLLGPLDSALSGRVTFRWSSSVPLKDNQAYELIFWQGGENPLTQGFSPVGITTDTSVSVDLGIATKTLDQLVSGQEYVWGLRLVQIDPPETIGFLGGAHLFRLE